jgi:hypothetical protein
MAHPLLVLESDWNSQPKRTLFEISAPKSPPCWNITSIHEFEGSADKLYSLLRNHGVSLAFVVHPYLSLNDEVTADFIYIRWEGNRKKVKDTLSQVEVKGSGELETWADKFKDVTRQWVKDLEGKGLPAKQTVSAFNEECEKRGVTVPAFPPEFRKV